MVPEYLSPVLKLLRSTNSEMHPSVPKVILDVSILTTEHLYVYLPDRTRENKIVWRITTKESKELKSPARTSKGQP